MGALAGLDCFKELVANTTQWQTIVDVGEELTAEQKATAAKTFIKIHGKESGTDFPYMLIKSDNYSRELVGYPNTYNEGGDIGWTIYIDFTDGTDWDAEHYALWVKMDALTDQILALANNNGYLLVNSFEVEEIIRPSQKDEDQNYFTVRGTCNWGTL